MQTVDLRNTGLLFSFRNSSLFFILNFYNDIQNQDAFLVVSFMKIKSKVLLPTTGLFIILGDSEDLPTKFTNYVYAIYRLSKRRCYFWKTDDTCPRLFFLFVLQG